MVRNPISPYARLSDLVEGAGLLAALAAVAALFDGALASVLALVVVVAWIAIISRTHPGIDVTGWSRRERRALFVAQLAPALVGLVVADTVARGDWFAFVAAAIAFPLVFVSRAMYARWRRHDHDVAQRPA